MHNTEKSSTGPNQQNLWEVEHPTIDSKNTFEVPFDFISSQTIKRYLPDIPTSDLSYTSSPDIPHQDPSSNEELRGVSSEEPLYLIPKNEVNQLRHHTRAYLNLLGQIPIIYQIPRSWFSQKRTQQYSDGEPLTSNIDDLIIDTIYDIRQPIIDIVHSETSEDPVDFQGDSTFFNFPETNPPLGSIPSPRLNFTLEEAWNPIHDGSLSMLLPFLDLKILYPSIHKNFFPNLISMMTYYLKII